MSRMTGRTIDPQVLTMAESLLMRKSTKKMRKRKREKTNTWTKKLWNSSRTVLNKRAAQLHCRLKQRMEETPVLEFASITKRKDTRKIAAQKFYSLLVLQKFMAVELAQDDACYGRMQVSRGKQFELDTSKVKAN